MLLLVVIIIVVVVVVFGFYLLFLAYKRNVRIECTCIVFSKIIKVVLVTYTYVYCREPIVFIFFFFVLLMFVFYGSLMKAITCNNVEMKILQQELRENKLQIITNRELIKLI